MNHWRARCATLSSVSACCANSSTPVSRNNWRATRMRLPQSKQLSHDTRTSVTAQLYSALPLREAQPDLFSELVAQYGNVLDQRLEQRAYKIETNTSDTLREIANQLGFLRAGPRDVVDVHTYTIRQRVRGTSVLRMQAYVEEGRLLVLELMGYLVSYYRSYALGGIH
jgi:hypothetical protein